MPRKLRVRELTSEEAETVERLARSRTAATREVERAQIIWRSSQGDSVQQIAQALRRNEATVREWIKRFNAHGLKGLNDEPRAGRPTPYSPEEVSEVIGLSLTDPQSLGLPFASWTLDRLEAYLNEVKGIGMKRSRIDEVLQAEGLRWRTQETWFGERVDPDFAQKRG
jgi:transposase